MSEETINQEFKRRVKEAMGDIEKDVALEMWGEHSRKAKTLADLMTLANEPTFKEYQEDLKLNVGGGSASTGNKRTRTTFSESEKEGQVELVRSALTSLKAKDAESGVGSSAIFEAVKGDGEVIKKRWNAIKEEMKGELGHKGELRNTVYWLKK